MATGYRLDRRRTESSDSPPSPETLLDLLGDTYTRRVLEAVSERPRGGRAVADVAGVSRATAYRRLNDLEDAGLVASEHRLDPDGHHRNQYVAVAEHLSISLEGGSIDVTLNGGSIDATLDTDR